MLTLAELEQLTQIEIEKADRRNLVDIQTIKIDSTQSVTERMESYLEQIKNPYLFLCDDTAVKIRFKQDGNDLKHKLKSYYTSTKKG
jgi:hypothetical protein